MHPHIPRIFRIFQIFLKNKKLCDKEDASSRCTQLDETIEEVEDTTPPLPHTIFLNLDFAKSEKSRFKKVVLSIKKDGTH